MPLDLTTIADRHDHTGSKIRKFVRITGPTSYATGGEALAPQAFGMGKIILLLAELASNGTDLRLVLYDYTNQKVKWFDLAGAEIANGTALNAYAARAEVIGA